MPLRKKARRQNWRNGATIYILAIWLGFVACAGAGILFRRPSILSSVSGSGAAEEKEPAANRYLGVVVAKDILTDTCTRYVLDNASGGLTAQTSGNCDELLPHTEPLPPSGGTDMQRLRSIRSGFVR